MRVPTAEPPTPLGSTTACNYPRYQFSCRYDVAIYAPADSTLVAISHNSPILEDPIPIPCAILPNGSQNQVHSHFLRDSRSPSPIRSNSNNIGWFCSGHPNKCPTTAKEHYLFVWRSWLSADQVPCDSLFGDKQRCRLLHQHIAHQPYCDCWIDWIDSSLLDSSQGKCGSPVKGHHLKKNTMPTRNKEKRVSCSGQKVNMTWISTSLYCVSKHSSIKIQN